jgi:hypothetical protein
MGQELPSHDEASQDSGYRVLVLDNFHIFDPEEQDEVLLAGFPSFEAAREYARRRTRASLEEMRKPDQAREELRFMWFQFGESAQAIGREPGSTYYASADIDFFIDNPASEKERDWAGLASRLGVRVQPRQSSDG